MSSLACLLTAQRGVQSAVVLTHLLTHLLACSQFNEACNQLSSKDLYGLVGIVEESCKRAIDQSSPSEVEIDIDALDLQARSQLSAVSCKL